MDLKKIQKKLEDAVQEGLKKVGVVASGASFFSGARKGESAELQADLNSNSRMKQSNALKRIIANMSLGRDVSQLFADVVKLGQSTNLEIKKLVYLYVLSNARLQPEKALLAVNTFLLDCHTNSSPIIRALAIRTMLCLRVDSVIDYLVEPLKKALTVDGDPYVKKTACLGVLKLFHQSPKLLEDHAFLPILVQMVGDTNPVVASNAAAALHEIMLHRGGGNSKDVALPSRWADKLLHTLPECSEWGQVYILDLLSTLYDPAEDQVEMTIERIVPRLSHLNAAVVLAAVKCVLLLVRRVASESQRANYVSRVNSALVTLSRTDPDTQYIVIKNVQALLPIYPALLRDKIDGFFVRFNDPLCVKREKLRLLMMLMHEVNADKIIKELAEYTTDVDQAFLSRVIHAVAVAAIKQPQVARRCVELLHSVAEQQKEMLPHVFVAAKNLLRRHPELAPELMKPLLSAQAHGPGEHHQHKDDESAAAAGLSNFVLSTVEADLDATVSLVWILGEFCDVLPNGMAALDHFTGGFATQEPAVQNAVMTALVKLFLRNPAQVERLLTPLFETATKSSLDPDVRDRAYMYWRLLSKGIGVEKMKAIVHSAKPAIDVDERGKHRLSTQEVLTSLNTAATALERPAKAFLLPYGLRPQQGAADDLDEEDEMPADSVAAVGGGQQHQSGGGAEKPKMPGSKASLDDIFSGGGDSSKPASSTSQQPQAAKDMDIFSGGAQQRPTPSVPIDPFATVAPVHQPQQQHASAPNNSSHDPFGAAFSASPPAAPQQQQVKKPVTADDLFA